MTRSHVEGLQLDLPLGGGTLMFLLPIPGGGVMILHTEVTIVINNSIFHSISWTNSDNGGWSPDTSTQQGNISEGENARNS